MGGLKLLSLPGAFVTERTTQRRGIDSPIRRKVEFQARGERISGWDISRRTFVIVINETCTQDTYTPNSARNLQLLVKIKIYKNKSIAKALKSKPGKQRQWKNKRKNKLILRRITFQTDFKYYYFHYCDDNVPL